MWCLAVGVPGTIAVPVLPQVRKCAGKVLSDTARNLKVSSPCDQKFNLQLVAVGRKQVFWTLQQRGGMYQCR